jgi:Dolichyl-phosphate-mannose-protein mannosyltransferase
MISQKARAPLLAALAIGGIFLAFAGDGIRAYFTPDDMMNLYVSWSAAPAELLHNDRPLGALAYRGLFALFGLNPLPYRIVCFVLLLANLGLLYRFCLRLSGSRETAAMACLLGAYHAHLADLYYSTGTIYDLLCCLFFLLAFNFYIKIRETGYPSRRQTATLVALYGCALASKEMAIMLPLYVALYEWIFHRAEWRRVIRIPLLWIAIPLTTLYAVRKVAGPYAMAANPDYAPHISLRVFLTAWKWYLGDLFYGVMAFNTTKLVLLWLLLAAVTAMVRRREVWFGWCWIILGVLPFIFIAPRGFS